MLGYPIINCMQIRQLLGRKRYLDPKPIDDLDLAAAKSIVDKFDAFIPLEYLESKEAIEHLKRKIPEFVRAYDNVRTQRLNVRTHKKKPPPDDFVKLLTNENKHETLLYEYVIKKLNVSTL
mmetsp:Transcript_16191/g.16368  ORF Transcript_16191/g.16368 Transcript_16191/m.16368 type:complete len:121 (-) Transcript_16191:124-486(-)